MVGSPGVRPKNGEFARYLIASSKNLNGSSDFMIFCQIFQMGRFRRGRRDDREPPDACQLNMTLSGTAWKVRMPSFDSDSTLAGNITDTDDGVRRTAKLLNLGDGLTHVIVTLFNTRVRFIEGCSRDTTLTLGNQRTRHIELGGGGDRMMQGNGAMREMILAGVTNIFNGSTGTVASLRFGGGTNALNAGVGAIGSVWDDATNTFSLEGGVDAITLGSARRPPPPDRGMSARCRVATLSTQSP